MALDLLAAQGAQFARLKTHSAGATLRAATGPRTGDGVIGAHQLRAPLPERPFVAYREGIVSGESEELRGVVGTWWCYDDPSQGTARINRILGLIEAAYSDRYGVVAGADTFVSQIGPAADDPSLGGLLARPIQITTRRRA